jgi:hypothetical protein
LPAWSARSTGLCDPDRRDRDSGAFLAKAFVERMPLHVHTAILDAAVMTGGLVMIASALKWTL